MYHVDVDRVVAMCKSIKLDREPHIQDWALFSSTMKAAYA